jgi:hypothetical protein
MARNPVGWRKEPARHALASRGISTKGKSQKHAQFLKKLDTNPFDAFWKKRTVDRYNIRDKTFQFTNVTPEMAGLWMSTFPKYLDPEDVQNMSPTMKELVDLARGHGGTLGGYAIPPESGRSDARITFDEMVLPLDELQARRIQDVIRADEFEKVKGGWRFWWD